MEGCSIARTDLEPPQLEPDPSFDPILESYFRQRLEQLYADPSDEALGISNGNEVKSAGEAPPLEKAAGNGEKAEYEFRLFARPPASSVDASSACRRIVTLRSLSPTAGDGDESGRTPSSARRGRPDDYYFIGATNAELAAQYAQAAVSGQDIIDGLKTRWRGMELPWRVTVTIKTTGRKEKEEDEEPGMVVGVEHHRHDSQTRRSGRKRSGKKRRIVLRRRAEKRAADEVAARRAKAEKEVAEREKKTRRNREKKVKRKRKDEVKKQMMMVDDGEGVG